MKTKSPEELAPHLEFSVETLLAETEAEYKLRVKGTSLSRVKFADFKRNLTAALVEARSVDGQDP